ncbi:hypothetical protein IJJ49_01925 [Candidatus Saccharibacteria bacterium]|nr:hypothetical protein [Candidatus Saccharibacteria bacterium]
MNGGDQNFGVVSTPSASISSGSSAPIASGSASSFSSGPAAPISLAQPQKKSKKPFLIAGIIAVLVLFIGIIVFFAINHKTTSDSDAHDAVWSFYYESSYQDLVAIYDNSVGLTPKLDKATPALLFPLSYDSIERLKSMTESVRESYQDFSKINNISGIDNFSTTKKNVSTTLDSIESNINLLSDFFDAFTRPIYEAHSGSKNISCEQGDSMAPLLNNSNQNIKAAADDFFSLYCEVAKIGARNSADLIEQATATKLSQASASLNSALKAIEDSGKTALENIISELEK